MEVTHGAQTLGLPLEDFLGRLKAEGLSTLPGTAAEVLDPEVRAILCPDKVTADEWIEVMRCAHGVGLRTTSTIMFGHVDQYRHWARHLLRIRALQEETGGFTRSEEHTSELQSLMRISYAVFCLKQTNK